MGVPPIPSMSRCREPQRHSLYTYMSTHCQHAPYFPPAPDSPAFGSVMLGCCVFYCLDVS